MASRDRFTINRRCSGCGETAAGDASENDYMHMRPHSGFSIDRVPEGYYTVADSPYEEARFMCKCGTLIYIKSPPSGTTNVQEDGTVQEWDGERWREGEDTGIGF